MQLSLIVRVLSFFHGILSTTANRIQLLVQVHFISSNLWSVYVPSIYLACQVGVAAGNLGLCCLPVTSFEC